MASTSVGEKYRSSGFRPNYPILIVPGLCCSVLEVVESPHEPWIGKRIWLDMSMIGLDKVLDNIPLFGRRQKRKKEKKDKRRSRELSISGPTNCRRVDGDMSYGVLENSPYSGFKTFDLETGEEVEMAAVDQDVKRRWIEHIVLGPDNISDPPGIRVRPVKGLKGCAYLDPRLKKFSYVWGPFIETLQGVGYDDTNLKAATYDWRLPPGQLEVRDGLFTEMKGMVEQLYEDNNKRQVVLMGHSLGTRCLSYFLRWAEKHCGREWTSKYVHTYIAIGPLFLGAPKSIRATISGERMGLDAFLYPEEGVRMTRNVGSSPWMYPIKLKSYGLRSFCFVRNERGDHISATTEEAMRRGDCYGCHKLYLDHYVADDCVGSEHEDAEAPPVDRMYAIYGVNLRTECLYFFKPSTGKDPVTKLVLDPEGYMQHYKCSNGIGYETKRTPQPDGRSVSGDGTVPYASLAHCRKWQGRDDIDVRITELEKCEHRDILKDKRFVKHMIDYVCFPPPPILLPEGFKDTTFAARLAAKGTRKTSYKIHLTRKGIDIVSRRKDQKTSARYLEVESVELTPGKENEFTIRLDGQSAAKPYVCDSATTLVTELSARRRYVQCLLATASKSGESHEARDEHGQTELHRAVSASDLQSTQSLFAQSPPADVNAVDNNGWSALHIASYNADLVLVEELLKREDIEVNMVSKDGTTPLHYLCRLSAAQCESLAEKEFNVKLMGILERMRSLGLNVNLQKNNGETALHQALSRVRVDVVKWLVAHGANVNCRTQQGDTPLHYAIMVQSEPLIRYLVECGADKHSRNSDQKTPLGLARETSKELFAAVCGVDVSTLKETSEAQDEYGQTALHKAAFDGRTDQVFELVNKGADPNILDKNGWTPLHGAASNGHLDCVLLILGAPTLDVNAGSKNQTNALHLLVRLNRQGVEKQKSEQSWDMFVNRGGDVNVRNRSLETPLHQAVLRDNLHAAAWLLDHGADVDPAQKRGDTPLHYAVRNRCRPMISLLLEYDADPELKGCEGTVMEMVDKIDPEMRALFEDNTDSADCSTPRTPDLVIGDSSGEESMPRLSREGEFSHKLGVRTHRRKKSRDSGKGMVSIQRLSREIEAVRASKEEEKSQLFAASSDDGTVTATVSATSAKVSAASDNVSLKAVNSALVNAYRKQAKARLQRNEALTTQVELLREAL